ncbi:MAG: class I SAM-dependent methyltransferase [Planctomycetes bacterium]|nr:class I SAM-dependent methyltransferase [Planctomycetota bacterium]
MYKLIVGPLKYGRRNGYDAQRYWGDRLGKHGMSLDGPGDEGIDEKANRLEYEEATRRLGELCSQKGVEFARLAVAEIGVGTGFYTGWLRRAGVTRYVGMDITDVLFPRLRELYPDYRFLRKDVTRDPIDGTFDLILMMDVIEHIVTESDLARAMQNIKIAVSRTGFFILSGVRSRTRKNLFYEHSWSVEDVRQHFAGWCCEGPFPYRGNHLLIIRKA